jgi:uncharacterized membrane protein (DUF373 family)
MNNGEDRGMLGVVKKLEHWLTLVLIAMLAIVVVLATVELGWTIAKDIAKPPVMFPGIGELLDMFGKFLLVVIGIELLETMSAFATDGVVRVDVVLTVAIIAIARKIVVLEPEHSSSAVLLGMAGLLAGLSLAYHVFVRGRVERAASRSAAPRPLRWHARTAGRRGPLQHAGTRVGVHPRNEERGATAQ